MITRGAPSAIRALNRRIILNHIRRLGPTSRAQLSEITGLSSAAISGVTAELIEDRLLTERSLGEAGTTGGRRPILLDIDYQAHYAVGIKMTQDHIEAVLTDLSTRVIAHLGEDLEDQSSERVVRQLLRICEALFELGRVERKDVFGIGLGLSGVIDGVRGVAVHAPLLGWGNVPIARLMSERSGLVVRIDNDINAFAAAERLFGNGKNASNFLVVAVGRGVGAAIVVNGEPYGGRDGGAGEFGHNMVVPGGRLCSCGRKGCLEAYTTEAALLEQYTKHQPKFAGNINDLVGLANSGDPLAIEVFAAAGSLLGTHLSYLVNAFNPELVIFGGEAARLGPAYFDPLVANLRTQAFDGLADDLPFVVVPWYNNDFTPWARGAASLAVQSAFDVGAV